MCQRKEKFIDKFSCAEADLGGFMVYAKCENEPLQKTNYSVKLAVHRLGVKKYFKI